MSYVLLLENEEDVGMRKSSLLEFHHIYIYSSSAHDIGIDGVDGRISVP